MCKTYFAEYNLMTQACSHTHLHSSKGVNSSFTTLDQDVIRNNTRSISAIATLLFAKISNPLQTKAPSPSIARRFAQAALITLIALLVLGCSLGCFCIMIYCIPKIVVAFFIAGSVVSVILILITLCHLYNINTKISLPQLPQLSTKEVKAWCHSISSNTSPDAEADNMLKKESIKQFVLSSISVANKLQGKRMEIPLETCVSFVICRSLSQIMKKHKLNITEALQLEQRFAQVEQLCQNKVRWQKEVGRLNVKDPQAIIKMWNNSDLEKQREIGDKIRSLLSRSARLVSGEITREIKYREVRQNLKPPSSKIEDTDLQEKRIKELSLIQGGLTQQQQQILQTQKEELRTSLIQWNLEEVVEADVNEITKDIDRSKLDLLRNSANFSLLPEEEQNRITDAQALLNTHLERLQNLEELYIRYYQRYLERILFSYTATVFHKALTDLKNKQIRKDGTTAEQVLRQLEEQHLLQKTLSLEGDISIYTIGNKKEACHILTPICANKSTK